MSKNTISQLKSTLLAVVACGVAAGCTVTTSTSSGSLSMDNVRFATSKEGTTLRSNATYKPGETAWILADVKSFKKDAAGKAHVQEDLVVANPTGKEILNKKNLLDFNEDTKDKDVVSLTNNLDLPPTFPGGVYTITMTARDVVGNATTTTTTHMTVDAPAATASPAAASAAPATPDAATPAGTPSPAETP